MADLSKTITNSLNLFGPAPSNKWAAYNWNAFKWGEGTAAMVKHPLKVLSESVTPSDSLTKSPIRVIDNSMTPTTSTNLESLNDSAGYYHVFPGNVTDAMDRVATSWGAGSATNATWTSGAASATSWSQS